MTRFSAAALSYARAGIAVFPLQPRDKRPYGFTTGLLAASSDVELVEGWWRGSEPLQLRAPKSDAEKLPKAVFAGGDANIGIATGEKAGFWVLDIDGPEGARSLAALEAEHGPLPLTVEQTTGSGRHICFRWNAELEIRNSASKIGEKIDVRGSGGYIVAPPSIHPTGRAYAWSPGRSPFEIDFADAPGWLIRLALPDPVVQAPSRPFTPTARTGRASPYAEKALERACADIVAAAPGTQNQTLFWRCYSIGRLVAGGELDLSYARPALINASLSMQRHGSRTSEKDLADVVERGLQRGEKNPRQAPELTRSARSAAPQPRQVRSAGDLALASQEAKALWASARSAWCTPARHWLEARALDPSGVDALALFKAHARAPWGRGREGPALLAPMILQPSDGPSALAVLPLHPDCKRFSNFVGEHRRKVVPLTPLTGSEPLIVALDLVDAWTLAQVGRRRGFRPRVVVAPTLEAFAGGFLGDRYGRVDPDLANADPDRPAWTLEGVTTVYLAVRRDIRSPEIKVRNARGGTHSEAMTGDQARRFFGGLAQQHWKRAGADAVRLLAPRVGDGFSQFEWGGHV